MSQIQGTIGGLGHGMLSLIGLGSLYDPVGDLRGKLSQAQSAMQNMINLRAYDALKEDEKIFEDLITYISTNNTVIQETQQLFSNMASNTSKQQNVFLSILSCLIFILIFFMLIRK
jgi:Mg2+ and Co2+ transporter CorA